MLPASERKWHLLLCREVSYSQSLSIVKDHSCNFLCKYCSFPFQHQMHFAVKHQCTVCNCISLCNCNAIHKSEMDLLHFVSLFLTASYLHVKCGPFVQTEIMNEQMWQFFPPLFFHCFCVYDIYFPESWLSEWLFAKWQWKDGRDKTFLLLLS